LLAALAARPAGVPPAAVPAPGAAAPAATIDPEAIRRLLAALASAQAGAAPPAAAPVPALSPIDKLFGGEALAGKKTMIAVLAFAALAIFQPAVLAGTAVGAPSILATLISAFGGLGLVSKFDRVIQLLGLMAAKPAAPGAPPAAAGVEGLLSDLLRRLAERGGTGPGPQPAPTPRPGPLPPLPPPVFTGRTKTLVGKMSHFGGPEDTGVSASEGLALVEPHQLDQVRECFLPQQPPNTTGLARRLNPDASYIACRWVYAETSKAYLRSIKVQVINPRTGQSEMAQPIDWGPHERTGRVADLSPGLERRLGLRTDQECVVVIPLP
jgi:hypothetical protein